MPTFFESLLNELYTRCVSYSVRHPPLSRCKTGIHALIRIDVLDFAMNLVQAEDHHNLTLAKISPSTNGLREETR